MAIWTLLMFVALCAALRWVVKGHVEKRRAVALNYGNGLNSSGERIFKSAIDSAIKDKTDLGALLGLRNTLLNEMVVVGYLASKLPTQKLNGELVRATPESVFKEDIFPSFSFGLKLGKDSEPAIPCDTFFLNKNFVVALFPGSLKTEYVIFGYSEARHGSVPEALQGEILFTSLIKLLSDGANRVAFEGMLCRALTKLAE